MKTNVEILNEVLQEKFKGDVKLYCSKAAKIHLDIKSKNKRISLGDSFEIFFKNITLNYIETILKKEGCVQK